MRILVYGAGVLGSYLAHVLVRGGNQVTMLARGSRVGELQESGLVIRHYVQCRTTADQVEVIEELLPEDVYELIFVVMQFTHLNAVLPVLAANQSKYIVLVGNNSQAGAMLEYLQNNGVPGKKVAFGFQSTGGRREKGKVICVRARGHMELGGLHEPLAWRSVIDGAFTHTRYKLTYFSNMEAWLASHLAMILPLCYAVYACEGDLRRASRDKKLLNQIINAIEEGYQVLETSGYQILPANEEHFIRRRRYLFYLLLKVVTATPIGKLAASDHAMSAVPEMSALSEGFAELKQRAGLSTPNWDVLEQHMIRMRNPAPV